MPSPFPFEENVSVAVLPAVADLNAPSIAEVGDGVDVTCDITRGGLHLPKATRSVDRTPWSGDLTQSIPDRYDANGNITAYRFTDEDLCELPLPCACAGELWDLCAEFRSLAYLLVRYGVPNENAWAVGDKVDAFVFRWGKRATITNSPRPDYTMFTVPIYTIANDDAASVVA